MSLIERQAAIDAIVKWAESHHETPDGDDCIMILQEIPPAQPIDQENRTDAHRCINCYYGGRPTYKFPCCSCDNSNKWELLRRDK